MDLFGSKFQAFKQKLKEITLGSSSISASSSVVIRKIHVEDKHEVEFPDFITYGETFLKFDRFKDHEPYKITIYYVDEIKRLIFSGDLQGKI